MDVMNGLPSIIVALFVFGLLVEPPAQQSGFAASVALAIIMVPLIARGTQEVLLLVPSSLREAADALGVARWRACSRSSCPARWRDPHRDPPLGRPRRRRDGAADPAQLASTPATSQLNPFEPCRTCRCGSSSSPKKRTRKASPKPGASR